MRPLCALALVAIVGVASACGKKEPSFQEKLALYESALNDAIAEAKPAYDKFAEIDRQVKAKPKLDRCKATPPAGMLRVSAAKLALLNGAPSDEAGNLVAKGTMIDPDGESAPWTDTAVRELPATRRPAPTAAGDPKTIRAFVAENAKAVVDAPGFVVQTIDQYTPPTLSTTPGRPGDGDLSAEFKPGSIEGRVIVFHADGKPQCEVTYTATNNASTGGQLGFNGGLTGALERDLARNARKAIDDAFAKP